jgi:hypothetical protein
MFTNDRVRSDGRAGAVAGLIVYLQKKVCMT